jgi:hypothetical protein
MIIKNLYFRHHVFPVLSALIFILFAASCGGSKNTGCSFSAQELELLNGADTIMRVLTDYITLNVPPRAFSNVPLQIWSL